MNYCSKDCQNGHWEEGHKEHCKTSGSQDKITFQAHISYNRNHNINTHHNNHQRSWYQNVNPKLITDLHLFLFTYDGHLFYISCNLPIPVYRLMSKIISEFFVFGGGERKSNSNVTRLIWIIKSYMIPILKFRCNRLPLRNFKNKEAKTDLHLITLQ